jgi:hypothetical protein
MRVEHSDADGSSPVYTSFNQYKYFYSQWIQKHFTDRISR